MVREVLPTPLVSMKGMSVACSNEFCDLGRVPLGLSFPGTPMKHLNRWSWNPLLALECSILWSCCSVLSAVASCSRKALWRTRGHWRSKSMWQHELGVSLINKGLGGVSQWKSFPAVLSLGPLALPSLTPLGAKTVYIPIFQKFSLSHDLLTFPPFKAAVVEFSCKIL